MLTRLAAERVVDLPLDGDQIVGLECDNGWRGTCGGVALSRRQWWQRVGPGWTDAWRTIAGHAARASPQAFVGMTQLALQGALDHVSRGLRTQRYQQVVIIALDAAAGQPSSPRATPRTGRPTSTSLASATHRARGTANMSE